MPCHLDSFVTILSGISSLPEIVHANVQIRAAVKRQNAGKYATKVKARSKRKEHVAAHPAPRDELAGVFRE